MGPNSLYEVAVRDILPGEELTDDYAALFLQPHESFDCHCRAEFCRQRVSPADAEAQADAWEALFGPL